MDKNIFGNKIKWIWTMRKLNTPLSVSSYPKGIKMGQDSFKYPLRLSATWYDYGDIYFDEEEMNLIREFLKYKIKNDPAYPNKIAEQIFSLSRRIDRYDAGEVDNKNLKQLIALFKNSEELFLKMIGFMSYRGSVQMSEVLREQIEMVLKYKLAESKPLNLFQIYLERLSYPLYKSVVAEEKKFVLRLAKGFKRISEQGREKRINLYLEKFEWLSYHWFVGISPSKTQIKDKLNRLSLNVDRELTKIKIEQKKNEGEVKKIVKELKFSSAEKLLLKQYRSWLFLRTYVKDNLNKMAFKSLPILYAIAEQKQIEPKLIPFLTSEEIYNIESLAAKEINKLINERKNGFSAGIIENKFSFRAFNKMAALEKNIDETKIKGSIAFKGIVQGIVKVIMSPKEQGELKKGEILVTSMTTPDLLPAMERAIAFVTDEGGITCHAAIVAREMKKPCIIGTKTATKILRNGDLVEVDAINGYVNIIKRNDE
ncbi:MAG: PEP-utilizing enzyme [bacterium]|nr:PEP-utilizing enzyme [bacterium]